MLSRNILYLWVFPLYNEFFYYTLWNFACLVCVQVCNCVVVILNQNLSQEDERWQLVAVSLVRLSACQRVHYGKLVNEVNKCMSTY